MKQSELEALKKIVEFENKAPKEDWSQGWDWMQVSLHAGTINRLIVLGFVEVTYRSNRYTNYKLTDLGRDAVVEELVPVIEETEELKLPDEMFTDIVGYGDIKELLREVLLLDTQFHVLLAGPPALAKTMFLMDIEQAAGSKSMWVVGSAASKSGVWDLVAERKPRVLLITELEKMAIADTAGLLSLMEGGRLVRAKVGRRLDTVVKANVIADANRIYALPPELLSRFAVKTLEPYDLADFIVVVKHVLVRREGLDEDDAVLVAKSLAGKTQDVRDAVRVARLSRRVGVQRAVELLIS